MSRRAAGLGALALVAGTVVWMAQDTAEPQASVAAPQVVRHDFLEGLPLDAPGTDYALLLHEQVTQGGLRVVRDRAALQAAQGVAFYTDNPGAALKRMFLSILFLSPPGMPPSNAFVTLLKDKDVQEVFTCYRAFCQGLEAFDPAHTRDMAGLLEASEPVEIVTERFAHHDKARAAMFRLMQDADVVRIEPPNLPAPNSIVFPARVSLSLPAVLLETDETGQDARAPVTEAELQARFQAAFTHAYPETDAYRLGEMRISIYYPPQGGWPVVSEEVEGYVRDAAGQRLGLDRIMVIEPFITVDLTERIAEALRGPEAFAAMPAFLPREPAFVAERLDAMAEAHLGRPCKDCFKIELPVATVDNIKVEDRAPPAFPLTYYKVVRE